MTITLTINTTDPNAYDSVASAVSLLQTKGLTASVSPPPPVPVPPAPQVPPRIFGPLQSDRSIEVFPDHVALVEDGQETVLPITPTQWLADFGPCFQEVK